MEVSILIADDEPNQLELMSYNLKKAGFSIIKAENGLSTLASDERLRFHFWMLVAVRRFEAIYIQALYGSIERERIEGFERSIMSLLSNVGSEWWKATKSAFSKEFIIYADSNIASGKFSSAVHPGKNNQN